MGKKDKVSIAILGLILSIILCVFVIYKGSTLVTYELKESKQTIKEKPKVPPEVQEYCRTAFEDINSGNYGNIFDKADEKMKNKGSKDNFSEFLKKTTDDIGKMEDLEFKKYEATNTSGIWRVFMHYKSPKHNKTYGLYMWINREDGTQQMDGIKFVNEVW